MSRKSKEPVFDDDNPEWTKADFAKARPPAEVLPPELLAQFKNTRGPQKTPTKVAVSIRLSRAGNRGSTMRCARSSRRPVDRARLNQP
jgi:uncharacterized protein (DUF4415 family)